MLLHLTTYSSNIKENFFWSHGISFVPQICTKIKKNKNILVVFPLATELWIHQYTCAETSNDTLWLLGMQKHYKYIGNRICWMINAYARLMSIYAMRHSIISMHGKDCASYNSSSLYTIAVDIWNLSLKRQPIAVLSSGFYALYFILQDRQKVISSHRHLWNHIDGLVQDCSNSIANAL